MSKRLEWTSAADSHIGLVRKINEDAYLNLHERGLWAVADGMGGHEAGDVASKMIAEMLRDTAQPSDIKHYVSLIKERLTEINKRLREESARHYHNRTIGSTVVVFVIYGEQAACLWVGDSRIYRLRNNRLEQLTRDHSHVQDLMDQGIIDAEQAHNHPMANVITRAVGSSDHIECEARIIDLQHNDVFLLCSDGLNKVVTDEQISTTLDNQDSEQAVAKLIRIALDQGAHDNVTTAVIGIV